MRFSRTLSALLIAASTACASNVVPPADGVPCPAVEEASEMFAAARYPGYCGASLLITIDESLCRVSGGSVHFFDDGLLAESRVWSGTSSATPDSVTRYRYDEAKRLVEETLEQSGTAIKITGYEYDDRGRVSKTTEQRPDGTVTLESRNMYDQLDRVVLTNGDYDADGTIDLHIAYSYSYDAEEMRSRTIVDTYAGDVEYTMIERGAPYRRRIETSDEQGALVRIDFYPDGVALFRHLDYVNDEAGNALLATLLAPLDGDDVAVEYITYDYSCWEDR